MGFHPPKKRNSCARLGPRTKALTELQYRVLNQTLTSINKTQRALATFETSRLRLGSVRSATTAWSGE